MLPNHVQLLTNTPLFGGIRTDIIQLILEDAKMIDKWKGQYFFKENELAESMFLLINGQVEVQKTWKNKTYQIAQLFAGDCFGEMAIIDHNTRSASVIATEPCKAIELDINYISNIYSKDIKQYSMLQMNMGREVSRRLRQANELLFQTKIENDLKDNISAI